MEITTEEKKYNVNILFQNMVSAVIYNEGCLIGFGNDKTKAPKAYNDLVEHLEFTEEISCSALIGCMILAFNANRGSSESEQAAMKTEVKKWFHEKPTVYLKKKVHKYGV